MSLSAPLGVAVGFPALAALAIAVALDLAIAEPPGRVHPVALFGSLAEPVDRSWSRPRPVGVAVAVGLPLLAAAVAGGVLAAIPAWLRAKWDINEIITSLLLTFVALEILSYMVRGPMQGGSGNFPQTERFSDAATIPTLFTRVHAGILVAVLMVALTYVIMSKTRLGFEITFIGSNDEAAVQAGMSKYKVYLFVFILSGAFAGMGGISEVAGVQGRLRAGFEPGYGFTAIPIALLGRNSAIKVMLAALFFALLFVGGTNMEVFLGIPAALVEVIQALIILFLIAGEFFKSYRVTVDIDRSPAPAPAETPKGDA